MARLARLWLLSRLTLVVGLWGLLGAARAQPCPAPDAALADQARALNPAQARTLLSCARTERAAGLLASAVLRCQAALRGLGPAPPESPEEISLRTALHYELLELRTAQDDPQALREEIARATVLLRGLLGEEAQMPQRMQALQLTLLSSEDPARTIALMDAYQTIYSLLPLRRLTTLRARLREQLVLGEERDEAERGQWLARAAQAEQLPPAEALLQWNLLCGEDAAAQAALRAPAGSVLVAPASLERVATHAARLGLLRPGSSNAALWGGLLARAGQARRWNQALLLSLVNDSEGAAAVLAQLGLSLDPAASGAWAMTQVEPSAALALEILVRSGLQQHGAALGLARRLVEELEQRRAALFDERLRAAFLQRGETVDRYGSAVLAAARAGQALEALRFMELARARASQELLVNAAELRPLRALARILLHAEQEAVELGCGETSAGRCAALARELPALRQRYDQAQAQHPLLQAPASGDGDPSAALRLPRDTALLSYFLTSGWLVIVALPPGAPPQVVLRRAASALVERQALRLVLALSAGGQAPQEAAALAALLLPPELRGPLSRARHLWLLPHGALHEVPFAALPYQGPAADASAGAREPSRTDATLGRRFALRHLPFLELARRAARGGDGTLAVLAHGPDLRQALPEAQAVAVVYAAPRCSAAQGQGAVFRSACSAEVEAPTSARALAALRETSVVHLIAHGASRPDRLDAQLALLPSAEDDGALTVPRLLLSAPLRARVVVLSACDLGMGRRARGDDRISLPRALLLRGAGAVVASLWPVPDSPALLPLWRDFHQALRAGQDSATALTLAQRRAQERGAEVSTWAGFVVYGRE